MDFKLEKKSKDHSINQKFETILAYTENGAMQVDHNKMVCHSCNTKMRYADYTSGDRIQSMNSERSWKEIKHALFSLL